MESVRRWGILMNSPKSMPSLAMLRAFDAFGRVGGIRKAAQMLDVDHAVISRHLTALESFVGTALIDRSNGVRTLTSDGIEYHRRISAAFQEITNATVMLRKRRPAIVDLGQPGIAYHWLGPRLTASFNTEGSMGLELRPMDYAPISPSTRPMATFAIFATEALWNHLRDAAASRFPAPGLSRCQPQCRRDGQAPAQRPDLLNMRLLHEESDLEWRLWFSSQGLKVALSPLAGPRLWHAHVALEAAKRDQGIALANPISSTMIL
jgi:DNA-binding transcriptional LysR family regulator